MQIVVTLTCNERSVKITLSCLHHVHHPLICSVYINYFNYVMYTTLCKKSQAFLSMFFCRGNFDKYHLWTFFSKCTDVHHLPCYNYMSKLTVNLDMMMKYKNLIADILKMNIRNYSMLSSGEFLCEMLCPQCPQL